MSLGQRILIALTTATFVFGGQLRTYSDPMNRFFSRW